MDLIATSYTKKMMLQFTTSLENMSKFSRTNKNQSPPTSTSQFNFFLFFLTRICLTTSSSMLTKLKSFGLTLAGLQGSNQSQIYCNSKPFRIKQRCVYFHFEKNASHKNNQNLNCYSMLPFNFVDENSVWDLDISWFSSHVFGIKEIIVKEGRMKA